MGPLANTSHATGDEMLISPPSSGAPGLSPKTIHNVHGVLHRALEQALRWRQLDVNVAHLVDALRRERPEVRPAKGFRAQG